jgi:hypothetical protein
MLRGARRLVLVLALGACAKPPSDPVPVASASPRPLASTKPARAALEAPGDLVELAVPGFGAASVAVPRGAIEPRPVVVALHGHAVRPEHACPRWQHAAHGWPFVLCPLGLPADARADQPVTLGSAAYTAREIHAGLDALRQRFAGYVSPGPAVLAGWSQGAKIGLAVAAGDEFQRIAIGEGGYDLFDEQGVRRLAQHGVRRALLLCATRPCELSYARPAERLGSAGIAARVAGAGGTEHPFDGDVVETAYQAWPWLVEGDSRFSAQ